MTLTETLATTKSDEAGVRAILDAIAAGYRARDAAAIARHYLPDARIADLAPPLLRRGFDPDAVQLWLDGWDGPVEVAIRDVVVDVDATLAIAHGLQHIRTRTLDGTEAAWWSRITRSLRSHASGLADRARARVGAFPHGRQLPGGRGPRALSSTGG
jgi:ketosteroid isomerase-like protein